MKLLLLFFLLLLPVSPLLAQSNKLIKELESKRGALQKQIAAVSYTHLTLPTNREV